MEAASSVFQLPWNQLFSLILYLVHNYTGSWDSQFSENADAPEQESTSADNSYISLSTNVLFNIECNAVKVPGVQISPSQVLRYQ